MGIICYNLRPFAQADAGGPVFLDLGFMVYFKWGDQKQPARGALTMDGKYVVSTTVARALAGGQLWVRRDCRKLVVADGRTYWLGRYYARIQKHNMWAIEPAGLPVPRKVPLFPGRFRVKVKARRAGPSSSGLL